MTTARARARLVTTTLLLLLLLQLAACSVQAGGAVRKVITAGEDLILDCEGEPDLGGLIVWKHGARVLFAGDLRVRRDSRLAVRDTTLIVGRLAESDGGEFSCETEKAGGLLDVRRFSVEVLSRPEVRIRGGDHGVVTVKAGARLELVCQGSGRPSPAVSWWRGGQMVSRSRVGRAVLRLQEVTASQAGQLTCKADNGVGGLVEENILLSVLAPPTASITSSLSSCNLQVTCSTSTSSLATVRLMYGGRVVVSDTVTGTTSHHLALDICREAGGSEVSCLVENSLGSMRDSLIVSRKMVEPPSPPSPPLPLLSSSTSLSPPALLLLASFLFKL